MTLSHNYAFSKDLNVTTSGTFTLFLWRTLWDMALRCKKTYLAICIWNYCYVEKPKRDLAFWHNDCQWKRSGQFPPKSMGQISHFEGLRSAGQTVMTNHGQGNSTTDIKSTHLPDSLFKSISLNSLLASDLLISQVENKIQVFREQKDKRILCSIFPAVFRTQPHCARAY